MKLLNNPWTWFALFCVALFFIVQMMLAWCVQWAVDTTYNAPNNSGYSLPELWERDSYGVQQAKYIMNGEY